MNNGDSWWLIMINDDLILMVDYGYEWLRTVVLTGESSLIMAINRY